ncbi:hypothetical protein NC652_027855 [Populus alba x Populus x berolinensis]|nr:hypothetical protein NC652_027855 [Populus alba x Populus x berolinensis]
MVPVWVKFPNLPLQCWYLKCLSKIASVLGKPVQSDMLTHTMSRLSYARVLVEINLLSDLPYSIDIKLPNGSLLKQQVIYETLPRFCKQCRILGHLTSTCPKSIPLADPSKQAPLLAEPEQVAESGAVDHVSGGWNIVQSKRLRRKNSPSKQPVSGAVDHCSVHESSTLHAPLHAPVHPTVTSKDHHLPSHLAANTNVLAGSRKDKGKAVVVSVDLGLPSAGISSAPLRRRGAQLRNVGVSGRVEGLLPTPLS